MTEAQPQPYHRLLLTSTYRWWRPLLGIAVFTGVFVALAVAVQVAAVAADVIRTGGPISASITRLATQGDPLFLLVTNLTLAAAIPAAAVAMLVAHRRGFGWLSSVTGRLRWGLLARMTALAAVTVVVFTLLAGFLPLDTDAPADLPGTVALQTWVGFAAVVVLTTPLQAAAEEYAFRGYGFQALTAWLRTPWVPAVVTSLAFAFAHGGQNLPLFADRFAFGLIACWLVVRTGGLEAAIGLHVMNNAVIFLIAAAFDEVGDTLLVSEVPWPAVALDVAQMLAFAAIADRYVRRGGYRTRSAR